MEPSPQGEPVSPGRASPSDECTLGESDDDVWLRAVAAAPGAELPRADLATGTVVAATYEIVRVIGAGAMGVVYEATDRALGRRVALKLHPTRGRQQRVWREARAMARLADPHVVTVYEVGIHDDALFIAMELVQGTDARRWRSREPRRWPEVLAIYRQAALGLAAAHAVGIVHRDFKPDNLLVGDDGRVRVADFGLARESDDATLDDAPSLSRPGERDAITRTGAAMGTPAYMAPELFVGGIADARSDQYAFCVALHEALFGKRPQRGGPPTGGRGVPRFVHDALRRGLAEDPRDRFRDMTALVRALEPSRRTAWIGLGAATALVGAAVVLTRGGAQPCEGTEAGASAIWDDEHAARVGAAFERSGFPDARAIADGIAPAITDWATRAGAARLDACEATRVRSEQSEARMQLRFDCLDRMQRRVGALVASLERADRTAVERTADALASLPELERCADIETLEQVEPIASVDAEAHAALSERIDAIEVDRELGHAAAIADDIESVVAEARAAGYADNLAAAELLQGRTAIDRLEMDSAVEPLHQAIAATWRARDLEGTTLAMRLLARALGSTPSRVDEALRWLDSAVALAESRGATNDEMATFAMTRADVLYMAYRNVEAETSARAALVLLEPGASIESAVRTTLGNALSVQHRHSEAITELRTALALAERRRGPSHPEVAHRCAALALALEEAGEFDEAETLQRRALELRAAAYGSESAMAATSMMQLADNLNLHNDTAGALELYERAVSVCRSLQPSDDQLLIRVIQNMVPVLSRAGKNERARTLMIEALDIATRTYGADSIRVAELSQMMGTIEKTIGDPEAGILYLLAGVRGLERHLGVDAPRAAEARMALANAYVKANRTDEALANIDLAERVLASTPQPQPRMLAYLGLVRADALARAGREELALAASEAALAKMELAFPAGHVELGEALVFHSQRLVHAKRAGEARRALERAREMFDDPGSDPALVAEVDELLAQVASSLPAGG